ncbi:VOC family protein [Actinoplanes sp. HUAS TT8]|uniref:VOC family protein n=1 Tax=Actinoplanes sp. HUAS TT8 TaxID=3447453 RepID=UPI003F5234EE
MTSRLTALRIDAIDPGRTARFWAGLLGRELADETTLLPPDDTGFRIRFTATDRPKSGQNLVHFDLTSTDLADQERTVARTLERGGRHLDIGQSPEEDHVVLADPEGNEFCVVGPDNTFLAGCGYLGAVNCDGTQALGYFWSAALGRPLVWDQDEETAIQSPGGGPKITWSGPPLMPRNGDRIRFELAADDAEVDRLVTLGATVVRRESGQVLLADPDGNAFHAVP